MPTQSFISHLRKFVVDEKPKDHTIALIWEDRRESNDTTSHVQGYRVLCTCMNPCI